MEKAIILRYAEIHLKGNNRNFFENLLIENVKNALSKYTFDFKKTYCRYVISNYDESQEASIIDKLTDLGADITRVETRDDEPAASAG